MVRGLIHRPTRFLREEASSFLSSWRAVISPPSCGTMGLDALLHFAFLLFFLVNAVAWTVIARPLAPLLGAIGELERSGTTDQERLALLEAYAPELNRTIIVGLLATLLLGLLFVALFALLKTKSWALVRGEPFSWTRFRRNLVVALIAFLLLFLIPMLLLLVDPLLAAVAFLLLLFVAWALLPALFARIALSWRYAFRLFVLLLVWFAAMNLLSLVAWLNQWLVLLLIAAWLVWASWGRWYLVGEPAMVPATDPRSREQGTPETKRPRKRRTKRGGQS